MELGMIGQAKEDQFAFIKGKGMTFMELCRNNRAEAQETIDHQSEIKALAEAYGIRISSVGRWCHDHNVGGELDPAGMRVNEDLLEAAVKLGAKTFVCGCNYDDSVSLYKNYNAAIETFGRLLEKADGRIHVAVQNCDWNNFVVSPEQWKIVFGELPELGIKFDCSHAYNRGEDYVAQISDWGDKIYHFHIKGTVHSSSPRPIDDPPAGMDDLRWGAIFAALYCKGYQGDLSLEPHSRTWNGELCFKGVDFTLRYIRKFIL